MSHPIWDESASDEELLKEFYPDLLIRFPEITEAIEFNKGLLHLDMGALQQWAEKLCEERKLSELQECLNWVNSFYCRSQNELLNAINVSFLEYFEYSEGLSLDEFRSAMPSELYRGFIEMEDYMKNLGKP